MPTIIASRRCFPEIRYRWLSPAGRAEPESITALRRGDQLDEIGNPMPKGFVGQGWAGQQDAACVDSARREQRHVTAQAPMIGVPVPWALDQPDLSVHPDNPRQRAHHFRRKSKDSGAV